VRIAWRKRFARAAMRIAGIAIGSGAASAKQRIGRQ
jgi:hypothetical protein